MTQYDNPALFFYNSVGIVTSMSRKTILKQRKTETFLKKISLYLEGNGGKKRRRTNYVSNKTFFIGC